MKKLRFTLFVAALLCAVSCNSDRSTTKIIDVSSIKVSGTDSQYVTFQTGEHTLKFDKEPNTKQSYEISVVVTAKLAKKVGKLKNKTAEYGNIRLALLDEDGQRVDIDPLCPKDGGWERFQELLRGDVGSEDKIKFKSMFSERAESVKELEKVAGIEIVKADFTQSYEVSSSSSSSSSSSGKSWDSILSKYESYVNDYITLVRKANAGDMTAMANAVSMLEKANSLSEDLSGAESELSTTQMTRLMSISSKMASAAMSF